MERKYRKAINFDLSVHELEKYYPDYRKAYYDVKRFFMSDGLEENLCRRKRYLVKRAQDMGNPLITGVERGR